MHNGIRIESVASQIGAMGGNDFCVEKAQLRRALQRRYQSDFASAERAIRHAIAAGAVEETSNGCVRLVRR